MFTSGALKGHKLLILLCLSSGLTSMNVSAMGGKAPEIPENPY
jgi:hypothetical protein